MLDRLFKIDEKGIPYYFQFTITPYGKDMEPGLPEDKGVLIETFQKLSEMLGPQRVIWRYDPILINEKYSVGFHCRAFEKCATLLEGHTERVVISFLDMDYNNTKAIQKLGIRDGSADEKNQMAKFMADTARTRGMSLETCAEDINLDAYGINHGRCIDPLLIEEISGKHLSTKGRKKDGNQRELCGCIGSVDIGSYNTCKHACAYCYANYSQAAISGNVAQHHPGSAVLIGEVNPDELSFKKDQVSMFDERSSTGQLSLL